jgi:hypothetical protein
MIIYSIIGGREGGRKGGGVEAKILTFMNIEKI